MSSAPFFPAQAPASRATAGGRKNVVRVLDAWYIACETKDLPSNRPLARTILGVPLALFRDRDGNAGALLDRCPHRNVPLTLGTVKDGELTCAYHGWRFDCAGAVQAIPGLPIVTGELSMPGRRCSAFATREQDGYLWVWLQTASKPTSSPFDFVQMRWPGYTTVRWQSDIDATLHSTLENILDVPHTSFLHGGLFRSEEKKHEIDVVVRRRQDSVEAEFIGEPRPDGIAGRLLSPSGGVVTALSVRTRLPMSLVAPFIGPIAWKILAQDKWILQAQTELVDRFGSETFSSTPIDLLGPHILHLLKKAEAGALEDAIVRDEHFKLLT